MLVSGRSRKQRRLQGRWHGSIQTVPELKSWDMVKIRWCQTNTTKWRAGKAVQGRQRSHAVMLKHGISIDIAETMLEEGDRDKEIIFWSCQCRTISRDIVSAYSKSCMKISCVWKLSVFVKISFRLFRSDISTACLTMFGFRHGRMDTSLESVQYIQA